MLLDGTAVNVALPSIQHALGRGLAAQQWVVNAYLLTLGSLILIGGSLGDLFGERQDLRDWCGWLRGGLVGCAHFSPSGARGAARALQGVGALLVPSALAVIVAAFAESERVLRSAAGRPGGVSPRC